MKEPQKILSLTPGILKLSDTFTHREKEIINCVLLGLSNREIASELFISENTVKTHLYNIYQKYGVRNRTSLLHKLNHKP
ncbi:HTH-type transcriptional regulator MalT [bioreactor metagenome]|uniref:HTH-type transcriptional regulator MalT n=1 Tax=bioreactor metagenome TaxID=1076179 RepID=A0A645JEK8_9ZZZZ